MEGTKHGNIQHPIRLRESYGATRIEHETRNSELETAKGA